MAALWLETWGFRGVSPIYIYNNRIYIYIYYVYIIMMIIIIILIIIILLLLLLLSLLLLLLSLFIYHYKATGDGKNMEKHEKTWSHSSWCIETQSWTIQWWFRHSGNQWLSFINFPGQTASRQYPGFPVLKNKQPMLPQWQQHCNRLTTSNIFRPTQIQNPRFYS